MLIKLQKLFSSTFLLFFANWCICHTAFAQEQQTAQSKIAQYKKENKFNIKKVSIEDTVLVNLYIAAANDGNYSLGFADTAVKIAFNTCSFKAIWLALELRGNLFYRLKRYDEAKNDFNLVIKALNFDNLSLSSLLSDKKKCKTFLIEPSSEFLKKLQAHFRLADCYRELQDQNELSEINNAESIATQLKSELYINKANEYRTDYQTRQKQYEVAIRSQKLVVSYYYKANKNFRKYAQACELLGDLYMNIGDIKLADENYKKPKSVLDEKKDRDILCSLSKKLFNNVPKNSLIKYYKGEVKKYCDAEIPTETKKTNPEIESIIEQTQNLTPPELATQADLNKLKAGSSKINEAIRIAASKGDLKFVSELSILKAQLDSIEHEYETVFSENEELKLQNAIANNNRIMLENQKREDKLLRDKEEAESNLKEAERKAEIDKKESDKIFAWLVVVFVILLFVIIFGYYKKRKDIEQKEYFAKQQIKVAETEMKALRSQMNPHFIFNALQSIQNFLVQRQADDANNYLLKFSKLMRLVLENSQHSEVSVEKEMQALDLYMQLERIRLKHPFTYDFKIDGSVNQEEDELPPLLLQPFVENSIWHGLQHKDEPGHISICLKKENSFLKIIIEDNGIGRDMNKKIQKPLLLKKESLGMKLTEDRLRIISESKKAKAYFTITDLRDNENVPLGTKIELSLPLAT